MSDQELEQRLDLMEKRIHERLDHMHRRDKRIENYLFAFMGLVILLIVLVAWSWYMP
jgi:cell division septal protein FtsQ